MTGPYSPDERRQIVVECVRKSGLREAYVQTIMTRGPPPIGSRNPRLADTVVLGDGHGNITEGPGFNIFAVHDGALTTPEAGVLDGMTRRTVFELCDQIGVAYSREVLPRAHLAAADEVFLTTSGGGLIPITVIDGAALGDGTPGPLTTRLDGLYWSKREAGWHATPVDYGD